MLCNRAVRRNDYTDEISATRAHHLAGITYRQLDYWARRGWVTPSVDQGLGRAGRRLYNGADVVRLAALGHFGSSGLDIGRLGPVVARMAIDLDRDVVLVAVDDGTVRAVPAHALRPTVAEPGTYAVFDPAPLRARLFGRDSEEDERGERSA